MESHQSTSACPPPPPPPVIPPIINVWFIIMEDLTMVVLLSSIVHVLCEGHAGNGIHTIQFSRPREIVVASILVMCRTGISGKQVYWKQAATLLVTASMTLVYNPGKDTLMLPTAYLLILGKQYPSHLLGDLGKKNGLSRQQMVWAPQLVCQHQPGEYGCLPASAHGGLHL